MALRPTQSPTSPPRYRDNMNTRHAINPSTLAALIAVAAMGCVLADAGPAPGVGGKTANVAEMRDAPTRESMEQEMHELPFHDPAQDAASSDHDAGHEVITHEDLAEISKPADLIATSDIISFNGHTTLVPKHAILAIPPRYRDRVGKHVAGHKIVIWSEFYVLNRGWIRTIEVTPDQAYGKVPLAENEQAVIKKAADLTVATYQGGPISVLPPKDPAEQSSPESPNSDKS
jgi:hypothetical protein